MPVHTQKAPAAEGTGAKVTIHFQVVVPFTVPGDTIVVVGSTEELGDWGRLHPGVELSTSPQTFPIWEGRVKMAFSEAETATFDYKAVLVSAHGAWTWEATPNRSPVLALAPDSRRRPTVEDWVLRTDWQGPDAMEHCFSCRRSRFPRFRWASRGHRVPFATLPTSSTKPSSARRLQREQHFSNRLFRMVEEEVDDDEATGDTMPLFDQLTEQDCRGGDDDKASRPPSKSSKEQPISVRNGARSAPRHRPSGCRSKCREV